MKADVKKRFEAKVLKRSAEECWEWQGARTAAGYGELKVGKKVRYAHRLAYELHVGPVPKGNVVMHKCDNRSCCNPNHLAAGTQRENVHDMIRKQRASWQRKNKTAASKQIPAIA